MEAVFGPEGDYDLNFIRVNVQDRFYEKLAGVTEPEKKRKIIGEEFIRVFEEEAKKIGSVDFSGAGHHLSGCDRVRSRKIGGHQEPSQRRRSPGLCGF